MNSIPNAPEKKVADNGLNATESKQHRPIPKMLYQVDDGKIVDLVKYMRDHSKNISPEEMRLRLNPEEVTYVAEMQFSSKARFLEGARNIFLFLPLIFTWLSFALASSAFIQSAKSPANAGQSFFALWINGFPTLSSLPVQLGPVHFALPLILFGSHWFSFGDVALTDFFLLAAIMLINQSAYRAHILAHNRALEIGAWLRGELENLSQNSQVRSLGAGPDNKKPQWAVDVHTAINSLNIVLENVKVAVGQSQESFAETINRFTDTYQQQNRSVDGLIQNTRDIETAITQLLTMKDLYERLESILPEMRQHFEVMARQEERATHALASIATEIARASQAIVTIARPFQAIDMQQVAQQVADRQRANLETLIQMESRLREMNSQIARKTHRKRLNIFFPSRSIRKLLRLDRANTSKTQ